MGPELELSGLVGHSPGLEEVHFNLMKQGTSSARSRDEQLAARLWEESARLTGLEEEDRIAAR